MVETMGAELVSRDTSQLLGRVAALWRYPREIDAGGIACSASRLTDGGLR